MVVELCVNKEGYPLYIANRGPEVNFEVIAVEYSKNVRDSDFALPSKPVSINNMFKGMGQFKIPQFNR